MAALDQYKDQARASVAYMLPQDGKHTELKADMLMSALDLKSISKATLGIKYSF